MARSLTPVEVKSEMLECFPEGVGDLFFRLWSDVAILHLDWKTYRALHGTSRERVDLLNASAGAFFGVVDRVLRNSVLLRIARLTDPAASPPGGRRTNASLARLIDELEDHVDPEWNSRVVNSLEELSDACARIKDLRNRSLAHSDLETALNRHSSPLPGLSRADIEGVLRMIRELLGEIEVKFAHSRTAHEHLITSHRGDAETLILKLEAAREHKLCRQKERDKKYGSISDS